MWRSSLTMALGCTWAASKLFRNPNPPRRWFVFMKIRKETCDNRSISTQKECALFSPTCLSCVRAPNVAQAGSSYLNHSVVFKLQNDVHIIGIRHDSHDGFSESQQLIAAPRVSESSDVPGVFTPEDLGSFFRKHQHCYFVLGHLGCF